MNKLEALSLIKKEWSNKSLKPIREALLVLVPSLEGFEDEDEIHRKWILEYLYDGLHKADEQFKDDFKAAIDWLEKQKAQKPILEVFGFKVGDAVRLKDGDGRKHIIKSFEEVEGIHGRNFYHVKFEDNSATDNIYPGEKYPNGHYTHMAKFEEEQKPAEWSEEDDFMATTVENSFHLHCGQMTDRLSEQYKKFFEKVKSLRPQPRWKPSDAQIQALEFVLEYHVFANPQNKEHINSLCRALKNYKPWIAKGVAPKWLYRLEFKDASCGLWYDGSGKWCFDSGIGAISGC